MLRTCLSRVGQASLSKVWRYNAARALHAVANPPVGAKLEGLKAGDLQSGPLRAQDAADLAALLRKHGLLIVPGTPALEVRAESIYNLASSLAAEAELRDPDQSVHFEPVAGGSTGFPMVRILGTEHEDGARLCRLGYEWHVDSKDLTILACIEAPEAGGDTLFASTHGLFNSLNEAQQKLARDMRVTYSNQYTAGGPAWRDAEMGLRMSPTGTRLLRPAHSRKDSWEVGDRVPLPACFERNGEMAMVLSPKNIETVNGMPLEESQALVEELLLAGLGPCEPAPLDDDLLPTGAARFGPAVLQHWWRPGDIVLWDNRAVMHSTTPVANYRGRRTMLQCMFSSSSLRASEQVDDKFFAMMNGSQKSFASL